jgi:hypothetical protein
VVNAAAGYRAWPVFVLGASLSLAALLTNHVAFAAVGMPWADDQGFMAFPVSMLGDYFGDNPTQLIGPAWFHPAVLAICNSFALMGVLMAAWFRFVAD